jgi:hypothetical protein
MKIWQLVCGSVLVLSMTSCGNKTATTPPGEPATTGAAPTTEPAPTGSAPATTGTAAKPPADKPPSATDKPPADKPPATATEPATTTATGSGFPALKAVIGATKKAGEAANFDAATTEFSKFEDAWKSVEDKVKAKKPADYKAIETTVEAANMAIAKKDKTALLASLTKLSGSVDKVSK